MQELYEALLNEPTAANYLRVQRRLLQNEFPPAAKDLATLEMFCKAEAWDRAQRWAAEISDDFVLCPRFHFWRARIAEEEQDENGRELSVFELNCCLAAILQTGGGTKESPYQTLYPSDVQDVLAKLNLLSNAQHSVQTNAGCFDIVSCEDNQEVWFHQPLIQSQSAPLRRQLSDPAHQRSV